MPTDYKDKGLNLLKKGQKGIIHAIFSRFGLVLLMLVVQVLILLSILQWFGEFLPHILGGTVLFTFIMVIYLLNSNIDPTTKITWLIVIMLLPAFGVLLFAYTQSEIGHRTLKMRIDQITADTKESIPQSPEVMQKFSEENKARRRWHVICREAAVIRSMRKRLLLISQWGKRNLKRC